MLRLMWLLSWILEGDNSRVPAEDELAWRAACVRGAKLTAAALCAAYVVWDFGGLMAKRAAQPHEDMG
jgi:hypothetical protein